MLEPRSASGQMILDTALQRFQVGGVEPHPLEKGIACGDHFFGGQPEDFLHHRRGEEFVGPDIPDPMALVRPGHRSRVALLGQSQRFFRVLLRVDVADGSGHAQRPTRRIARAHTANQHPAIAAVGVADPIFALVQRRPSGKVVLQRGNPPLRVVRMYLQRREPFVALHAVRARRQPEQLARAR